MVFLLVSEEVLKRRLMARPDHFFPQKLLSSQLASLELPAPDEHVQTVLAEGDAAQTAAKIIALLWPYGEPNPEGAPVPGVLLLVLT
jgi:gluconokinase